MRTRRGFELTYCTNIHAAHGWGSVFDRLQSCAVELKTRINPDGRFGIGLRLSDSEARELLETEGALDRFQMFLAEHNLYVALLNGFPFGNFHDCRVKDQVFAPDWHTQERVDYTIRLITILARVIPSDLSGGVSTCPLSYRRWEEPGKPDWPLLIRNIMQVVAALHKVEQTGGPLLRLEIEPEPDGLVETIPEFIVFFRRLLADGPQYLAAVPKAQCEDVIRRHVALCYDLCHSAVQNEITAGNLQMLKSEGIQIGRVQVSSSVRVDIPASVEERHELRDRLQSFADPVYLHQIVGDCSRYPDLPEGLAALETEKDSKWRIHYHVPLFVREFSGLGSSQAQVEEALRLLSPEDARHLEIETYTWGVLPESLRDDIVTSIDREYRWVLQHV